MISKEKSKRIKRKERGITLIALVITIIVLLILAGISISTLTGQNGILTQSNQAKEKTEIETLKEELNLSKTSDFIDNNINGTENIINVEGYENLKKYIPSITEEYAEYLKIEDGELVYKQSIADEKKDIFIENQIEPETVEADPNWFTYDGGTITGFSEEIQSMAPSWININDKIKEEYPEWFDEAGMVLEEKEEEYYQLYDSKVEIENIKIEKIGILKMKLPSQTPDGTQVTAIGAAAFRSYGTNIYLEKVIIPEGVVSIGINAFISNKLTSIEIPSSVTKIEPGAFYMNSLAEVTFKGNTTTIGYDASVGAFNGNWLQKIKVPKEYIDTYTSRFNLLGLGLNDASKIEVY